VPRMRGAGARRRFDQVSALGRMIG
jgi:hypothetical protein